MKKLLFIIMCVCVCASATQNSNHSLELQPNTSTIVCAQSDATSDFTSTSEASAASNATPTLDSTDKSFVQTIVDWYSANMNYASITALMTIESSFIPFPSEVVVPPAAYVANDPDSPLYATESYPINVLIIILFASLGAMIGAIINYLLSMWLGRPIIYKFADSKLGHLCLLSGEKIKRAEDYFCEHGNVATFIGRMVPGIRQLISIPAGLAKMHFGAFLGYTFLGATLWNTILAVLGYILQGQSDLITKYSHEIGYIIIAILAIAICWVVIKKFVLKKK